ncbi:hypothetical protein F5146DRAFT_1110482 [Armillaria mellea]|nr:hypothetical protein F5146DRAFT_1110482 [Armillaria mellea]
MLQQNFGHKQFWRMLIRQQSEVERILEEVENRAYELILASQNALWVLKRPMDTSKPDADCSGYDEAPLRATKADECINQSQFIANDCDGHRDVAVEVEDPLEVALREKATILREKIYTRISRYCTYPESKWYHERLEVINAIIRRIVYTDASLMVTSQNYTSVMEFLRDEKLEVQTLSKLWTSLLAIDDVLRLMDDSASYVVVLGGRVYKDLTTGPRPFRTWAHFSSYNSLCIFFHFYGMDEVVALTQYTILTWTHLNQSTLKCYHNIDGSSILMLCGSIVNYFEYSDFSHRYSVTKYNDIIDHTPQWSETEMNITAEAFIDACTREKGFMVLSRRGKEGKVVRSTPKIWCKRTRRASTRAGLKKLPWEETKSVVYFRDSLLEECWTLTSLSKRVEDCYTVAVVDTEAENVTSVVAKLAKIWIEVYGVECIHELCNKIATPYVKSGDLEIVEEEGEEDANRICPKRNVLMPGAAADVHASYRRLWKKSPCSGIFDD